MADQAKFQAAYKAWRAATNDYDAALNDVMAGRAIYDLVAMQTKIKEMARLLAEFDAASIGIVHWKRA
jgi:hypothetical protein